MGLYLDLEVMGIRRGYAGLMDGEIDEMNARSVGGIIGQGGTILGTARCPERPSTGFTVKAARTLSEWARSSAVRSMRRSRRCYVAKP